MIVTGMADLEKEIQVIPIVGQTSVNKNKNIFK